jgi:hypothetical protein
MKQPKEQKDRLYWQSIAKLAEEASSRKEAVSLLHELQRHNDLINDRKSLHF